MLPCSFPSILDGQSGSQESLDEVDGPPEVSQEFDIDLQQLIPEQSDTWSGSVEKKVTKKMNIKDIKRQDTIWGQFYICFIKS